MPGFLFFVLFSVGIFLAARSAVLKIQQAAKDAQQPPPLPRRGGRARAQKARPPAAAGAEEAEERPAAPAPVAPPVLAVTRPPRAAVHFDFRGRDALRRAVVAREVLGPPLSLRPPRS